MAKYNMEASAQDARAASDDEIPLDELFRSADVVVDRIEFFVIDVPGPHVGDVHIADQLVQSQAKVVAEQDQPLEVGVGLTSFPHLKTPGVFFKKSFYLADKAIVNFDFLVFGCRLGS